MNQIKAATSDIPVFGGVILERSGTYYMISRAYGSTGDAYNLTDLHSGRLTFTEPMDLADMGQYINEFDYRRVTGKIEINTHSI